MRDPRIDQRPTDPRDEALRVATDALNEVACWVPDGTRRSPLERGAKVETVHDLMQMIIAAIRAAGGAREEVRRLTQANADLREERDRAVKEAQRQDAVAKGLRKERDALAADSERLRAALDRAFEGAARQLAEPRHHGNDQYALTDIATTCELALDATPAQSIAAHDAALLRSLAAKLDGEGHPANEYYRNWLMAEADRIETE